ncbi:MAG: hypothetical protein Fur0042_07680 [Cyanophyceae cyanobacterium]
MGFDGVWGRRTELLIWGRRSLPLVGSLLIHGLVLASLSAWEGRSPVATDWQVETVELTPEELARVPDLDPSAEPPLSPPEAVGGWQGLPVPSEGTQMPQGSRAADRWSLPSSLEDRQGDGGVSERVGRALYDRWLRQQERDRLQAQAAAQRRLQAQRDRRQAQREKAQREQEQAQREREERERRQAGQGGDRAEGTKTAGDQTQGTNGGQGTGTAGGQTQGTNGAPPPPREVAGPLTQLPPVAGNPPAPGDRTQFSFDGSRVGTEAAGLALGSLLADDAPWGQRYGEKPMRDGAGKEPEGMQGAWMLVDNDKPLEAVYRTPVALCSLTPEPAVIRLAVLMGPDGQRATGTPPDAFQPQVVTSSGYRALDDYAIAQLEAALTAQQDEGKKRLTPFDGYGVFVYAIRYAKSAEVCGPQGNGEAGGDRGDALTP